MHAHIYIWNLRPGLVLWAKVCTRLRFKQTSQARPHFFNDKCKVASLSKIYRKAGGPNRNLIFSVT